MDANNRKLDRRVVRTRRAIVEAFACLLAKYPLDKITISAIAREANIDRKTFYLHYSSVNDLVNQNIEESLERIASALRGFWADKSSSELLHIALAEVNEIIMEHLEVYEKIASTLSVDQLLCKLAEGSASYFDHLDVRNEIELDSQKLMRLQFYLAGALSLYSSWLTSDHAEPLERVSDAIEKAVAFPEKASEA